MANIIFNQYKDNNQLTGIDTNLILEKVKNKENIDMAIVEEILSKEILFMPEDKYVLIKDLIDTIEFSKLKLERKQITEEIQRIEANKYKDEAYESQFKSLCLRLTEIDKQLEAYK